MRRFTLAALTITAFSMGALSPAGLASSAASASARNHGTRAAADVSRDAAALTGPLAIGATVRDGAGETLGRISRLTTGADGQTVVMLRKGVDSFSVPASALLLSGDGVISTLSRNDIKALGSSATH
ncbi:MAG TPA: hypothetical protein VF459_02150 [Caulobacteraceae bacterium]